MSEALGFSELEAQQVELLPARTVLSMINLLGTPKPPPSDGTATCGWPCTITHLYGGTQSAGTATFAKHG